MNTAFLAAQPISDAGGGQLIAAALIGIAVIVVLITWLKVHPFLALIFGYLISWLADPINQVKADPTCTAKCLLQDRVDWSGVKGSSTCGVAGSCETKNDWLGTARGRIGYAFNRVMPYITGGLAVGNVKASSSLGSTDETRAGYAIGAGIEANIVGPWSAKLEYLYADLGKTNCSTCVAGGTDVSFHENIVRAGINYRF